MKAIKESTNICIVAPTMPPLTGGAETFAEVLTLGVCKLNASVHLLTAEEPRPIVRKEIERNNGSITILGTTFGSVDGFVGWEWAMFSRAQAISKIIVEKNIELIHALSHDTILSAAIAMQEMELEDKPRLVATTCEMSTEDSHFGIMRSRFIYNLPLDGLLQISQYYIDLAKNHGSQAGVFDIAAAVDIDLFASGKKEIGRKLLNIGDDRIMITCPSRFSPRKGQIDLLNAIEALPNDLKNKISCVLAGSTNSGSNPYLKEVEQRVKEVDFECIITEVQRNSMPDLLTASNMVVLPSAKEGLGFSAIESMIAGCPVILYDVSGFDEIPDEEDEVVFVALKDIQGLTEKIELLITNKGYRDLVAERGRKRAINKFSMETFCSRTEAFYNKVLTNGLKNKRKETEELVLH